MHDLNISNGIRKKLSSTCQTTCVHNAFLCLDCKQNFCCVYIEPQGAEHLLKEKKNNSQLAIAVWYIIRQHYMFGIIQKPFLLWRSAACKWKISVNDTVLSVCSCVVSAPPDTWRLWDDELVGLASSMRWKRSLMTVSQWSCSPDQKLDAWRLNTCAFTLFPWFSFACN